MASLKELIYNYETLQVEALSMLQEHINRLSVNNEIEPEFRVVDVEEVLGDTWDDNMGNTVYYLDAQTVYFSKDDLYNEHYPIEELELPEMFNLIGLLQRK